MAPRAQTVPVHDAGANLSPLHDHFERLSDFVMPHTQPTLHAILSLLCPRAVQPELRPADNEPHREHAEQAQRGALAPGRVDCHLEVWLPHRPHRCEAISSQGRRSCGMDCAPAVSPCFNPPSMGSDAVMDDHSSPQNLACLQYFAALGWEVESISTRADMATALKLDPEICQKSPSASPGGGTLFIVAAPLAPSTEAI